MTMTSQSESPNPLRKHLFILHSPITCILARLIIIEKKLAPEQVYFLCTQRIYNIIKDLAPANHFMFSDAYYDDVNSDQLTSSISAEPHIRVQRQVYDFIGLMFNNQYQSPHPNLTNVTTFKGIAHQFTYSDNYYECEFELYIPHLVSIHFYGVAAHPNCRACHIIEEGSMDYLDMEFLSNDWINNYYKTAEKQSAIYSYSNCGIPRFIHESQFNIKAIKNPNLEFDQCRTYAISNGAFKLQESVSAPVYLLDYKTLTNNQSTTTSKLITMQEKLYAYLATTLGTPFTNYIDSLGQFGKAVNIAVLDNLYHYEASEQQVIYKKFFQTIRNRGVVYLQVKFHPLQTSNDRQAIMQIMSDQALLYDILEDDVVLEAEFSMQPPYTFAVHSMMSSVLLYAAIMQQYVFEYQALMSENHYYYNVGIKHNFNLAAFTRYFQLENNNLQVSKLI